MVKLDGKVSKARLLMCDLKDGQIAEVIDKERVEYYGRIIQIYKDNAVSIGRPSGNGWTAVGSNTLEVRLLEEGERLLIIDNE
jgi:hypothetical protein